MPKVGHPDGHTAASRDKNGGEKTPFFLLGTEGVYELLDTPI